LFKKYLITEEELNKSKEQIKSSYILGLEDTFSRMINLGESELLLRRIIPHKEIIETIDEICIDDIERVVLRVFDESKYNIAYVGNVENHEKINNQLKEILFN